MRLRRSGKLSAPIKGGKSPRRCAAEGCDQHAVARGYCSHHYDQWRNGHIPLPPGQELPDKLPKKLMKKLMKKIGGRSECRSCHRPVHARGYCTYHHRCFLSGKPLPVKGSSTPSPAASAPIKPATTDIIMESKLNSFSTKIADLLAAPVSKAKANVEALTRAGSQYISAVETATLARVSQLTGGSPSKADVDGPTNAMLEIVAALNEFPEAKDVLTSLYGVAASNEQRPALVLAKPEPKTVMEVVSDRGEEDEGDEGDEGDETQGIEIINAKDRYPSVSIYATTRQPLLVVHSNAGRPSHSVQRQMRSFTSHVEWKVVERQDDSLISRIRNHKFVAVIIVTAGMNNNMRNYIEEACKSSSSPRSLAQSSSRMALASSMGEINRLIAEKYAPSSKGAL